MKKIAAIIGGGVIGGGWTARFLLMGWDVQVFDPDPSARTKIKEVLDQARIALPSLYDAPLPAEGTLSFHDTMSSAVKDAVYIQESVPERIELKNKVYATLQDHADPDAVIGSSTSGFTPTELQNCAPRPDQIVVAHPFVPVYLLPLVELVGNENTRPEIIQKAQEIHREIGMYSLHIKQEIPAHIADRFLEAVWREAVWLVNDGIATTQEIDEAIRMGFGLRWAQKGLFETYRIGGGLGGMKHFLDQFGPTLSLPWTKLMDTPEWTDELVTTIADQSEAQSGHLTIRELEAERDKNLVGILRALKHEDSAAGKHLKSLDVRLNAEASLARSLGDVADPDQTILTVSRNIPTDWTDYNGHMNEARYLQAFGDATDRLMELIGCDADYIATGGSYFTAETHIRHVDEVHAGDAIQIKTQVIEGEGKKLHLFHEMRSGDRLLATGEHMLLHVSLKTRKTSPPEAGVATALATLSKAQANLPMPDGLGRSVGQRP